MKTILSLILVLSCLACAEVSPAPKTLKASQQTISTTSFTGNTCIDIVEFVEYALDGGILSHRDDDSVRTFAIGNKVFFTGSAWNDSPEDFGNVSNTDWDHVATVAPQFWPSAMDTLTGFFIEYQNGLPSTTYLESTSTVRIDTLGQIWYKWNDPTYDNDWENEMDRLRFSGVCYQK